jgi:PAS domain-containing protein
LSQKQKILVLEPRETSSRLIIDRLKSEGYDPVIVRSVLRGLALLRHGDFVGVFAEARDFALLEQIGVMLQADQILEAIADGVALVDPDLNILWANPEFLSLAGKQSVTQINFYTALAAEAASDPPGRNRTCRPFRQ